ncbi:MAG TPA: hypothetical protein VGU23_05400 [Acidobacteriaceae bacterium]|nr:hypothetical protein [Acidobacteriaceae bacterium]
MRGMSPDIPGGHREIAATVELRAKEGNMGFDRSSFFGLWNVYSGPVFAQLLLHEDGTYGQSMWGGAQQVWGQWQLEDHSGIVALMLTAQGANPALFLRQFGPGPVVERHAVMSVLPNQIQLYDSILQRQFVPAQMPTAPVFPMSVAPQFPRMPVAPPVPAFSAPAPSPMPSAHSAPVLNQLRQANTQIDRQVADIQAQTVAMDAAADANIQQMYAGERQHELDGAKHLQDLHEAARQNSVAGFQLAMHGIYRV